MSCSQEYSVVLGEKHSELPKKTEARYVLLEDSNIYRKEVQKEYCKKCDVKHKVYKWIQIVPKCTIGFVDVNKDIVTLISSVKSDIGLDLPPSKSYS